jgi:MoaA/NifB/PqqE/SkfB family radical SAM enzyme
MIVDRSILSDIQLSNLNEGLQAYNNLSMVSSAYPAVLFLELTRNCISRCLYCRKSWKNDPKFDMSSEIFDIVLNKFAPYASLIDLRSYGESLMLGDFKKRLEALASVCPNLRITTTLGCGDEETLQALVDHDVFVSVSFDAADKELYEHYRRGIDYDVVMRNMQFLCKQMLKKYGNLHGRIRLGIAPLYRDNLSYVDGVLDLANRLQIPEIRILQLSSKWYDLNTLFYHKRKLLYVLQKAIKKADKYGIELQFGSPLVSSLKIPEKTCPLCIKPWLYSIIMFNGTMRYCDWQVALKITADEFGNIRDGADSVWNGDVARRVRKSHISSNKRSSICDNCYRIGRYSDHEHDLDCSFRKWLVTGNDIKARVHKLLKN